MSLMRILVLADVKSKYLYDFYEPGRLDGIDLIISCGDLEGNYLSFFATVSHAPVLYVYGNHDGRHGYKPPEGCVCIEDDIYVFNGVRILGLGGSMQYIPGAPNQYTEKDMCKRIRKLRHKIRKNNGFDILVTHAPAYQINDMDDLPHRGFECFRTLMDEYKPALFIHGHVHANYGSPFKRKDTYDETTIINAYESYIVEYPVVSKEEGKA